MSMYRKKPIAVEAFQWHGEEVPGFERIDVGLDELGNRHFNLVIETNEGTMYAPEGWWIITEIRGEKYPHDPEIFKDAYELVDDDVEVQSSGELLAEIGTDADKWAEAFCRIFPGKIDRDTMIVWFANAIMAGYDEGRNEKPR